MKKILLFLFVVITISSNAQKTHLAIKARPDTTHSGWVYGKPDTNKFTTNILYTARLMSINKTNNPHNKAQILLENDGDVNLTGFVFNKAVNEYGHDTVLVYLKFDGKKPECYRFTFPADDKKTIIRDYAWANGIILKVKTAKKLEISVDFVNGDSQIYSFNVAGLKWNHPGLEKPKKETIH